MKKSILIFAIAFTSVNAKAQLPCDSIHLTTISIIVSTYTFCTPMTYNPGQPGHGSFQTFSSERIRPEYADSSTTEWTINGSAPTHTPSFVFAPTTPGTYSFVLTGIDPTYPGCIQSYPFTFTVYVCQDSIHDIETGIQLYQNNSVNDRPTYTDLYGNVIEFRYNELIIERRGRIARKIRIEQQ